MKFLLALVLYFGIVFSVRAQGISTNLQGIDFKISNNNPTPGQTVKITAESYVSDLNSSNITWKVNNVEKAKGVGLTSIDVQAPALGKKIGISITAVTAEGRTMTNTMVLSSGSVDLIIETDGYTPPFFLGKLPLVYQNNYRIIAIPHLANEKGVEYDPATLVYQWSKDSRAVQDQSGYGRQVFSWKDEIVPRPRIISVKVFARDGSAQAEKFITVEAGSPFIAFYRDDSLYGTLYNQAITSNVNLGKSGEVSVLAVPFGFNNLPASARNLSYTWIINSIKQDSLSANRSITLRAPEGTNGRSTIELSVINTEDILEKAGNGFQAFYSNTGNSTAAVSNPLINNGI